MAKKKVYSHEYQNFDVGALVKDVVHVSKTDPDKFYGTWNLAGENCVVLPLKPREEIFRYCVARVKDLETDGTPPSKEGRYAPQTGPVFLIAEGATDELALQACIQKALDGTLNVYQFDHPFELYNWILEGPEQSL